MSDFLWLYRIVKEAAPTLKVKHNYLDSISNLKSSIAGAGGENANVHLADDEEFLKYF